MKKNLDIGIDFTKLIACIMVVVLHVSAIQFYSFSDNWWATNFYDSFVRCSVPIFLLVSGATLFGKEEGFLLFMKKRTLRVFPPLIFWSLLYMIWNYYNGIRYEGWIKEIMKGPVTYHLWYLYAILGIYLFTPFLIKIYANSSELEKRLFIFLWFLFSSIWPYYQAIFQVNINLIITYNLQSFSGLFGYLFLGAYLFDHNKNMHSHSKVWHLANYLLFFFSGILTMIATYLYSKMLGSPKELFYGYLSPFVIISAGCAFNILYTIGLKLDNYASVIRLFSKCILGIYCVHIFVLDRFQILTGIPRATDSPWWSIPSTAISVFGISFTIITFMRIIKPFRYLT